MREGGESSTKEECRDLDDGADGDYSKPIGVVLAGEVLQSVVESESTADTCATTTISLATASQSGH